MVELGKQNRAGLIKHYETDGSACNKDGQGGKHGPENTFARVMAQRCGSIDVRIRVMHDVKLPHPFHFVFNKMNEVSTDEVEQHETPNQMQPVGQFYQIQDTEMPLGSEIACLHQQHGKQEIHDYGGEREEQIDERVTGAELLIFKERDHAFEHPHQNKT